MATDNGLNYQNTSYMAAYATALAYYYILCFDKIKWVFFFKRRLWFIIIGISIIVNLLTIFIAGGRGGLVLYIAQSCLALYIWKVKMKLLPKSFLSLLE